MNSHESVSPMRVLSIVKQADAGTGVFAEVIRGSGVELEEWLIADGGRPSRHPREYDAVLAFGGAMHPDQVRGHPWLGQEKALLSDLVAIGVPVLGVCLGGQLLAEAAGGTARRTPKPEIGWYEVEITGDGARDPLLGPLAPRFEALEWHSYEFLLPDKGTSLARSATCLQAFRLAETAWGIQFHAEVTSRDFASWIEDYRSDEDAVAIGLDAEEFRDRTEAAMASWNELGRGVCERFLSQAANRSTHSRRVRLRR
jgi:GMP synthase (glutamine-hydrolysing)